MPCPVKDKICTKRAKRGRFEKVCRSTNVNYKQETDSQQDNEEEASITAERNNDPVAYAEYMSANGWEEIPQDSFTVLAVSEKFETRNSIKIKEDLKKLLVKLKTHSEDFFVIADSGSTMSFLNETTVD